MIYPSLQNVATGNRGHSRTGHIADCSDSPSSSGPGSMSKILMLRIAGIIKMHMSVNDLW